MKTLLAGGPQAAILYGLSCISRKSLSVWAPAYQVMYVLPDGLGNVSELSDSTWP